MRESRARRARLVVALIVILAAGGVAMRAGAADEALAPAAAGGVSGPPAPAVPAIAATPEPAAAPAVPGAPLEPGVSERTEPAEPPSPSKPRRINFWPWFDYQSDPAARMRRVRILGALLEYHGEADYLTLAFRPFISIRQARVGHDDDVQVLGPLLRSHWGQTEQQTTGLLGLVTYRTRTSEDGRTLESQRARVLPFYFYDWEPSSRYGQVSLAPFYADVDDLFGYERVQMVMFPAYLRLRKAERDRRYYLFFPVDESERDAGRADDAIATLHRTADDGLDDVALQRIDYVATQPNDRPPVSLLDARLIELL